jgi:hypothetical protein
MTEEEKLFEVAEKWLNEKGIKTRVYPDMLLRFSYDILVDLGNYLIKEGK